MTPANGCALVGTQTPAYQAPHRSEFVTPPVVMHVRLRRLPEHDVVLVSTPVTQGALASAWYTRMKPSLPSVVSPSPFRSIARNWTCVVAWPVLPEEFPTNAVLPSAACTWSLANSAVGGIAIAETYSWKPWRQLPYVGSATSAAVRTGP